MLKIAICDDDIKITGKMDMLVQKIAKMNYIQSEIDVFWDGKSLVDAIKENHYFDIIYLDIEMEKEDGITTAKKIREYDRNVHIIYVTSHENYVMDTFSVRPFRFFVKPVSEQLMAESFKAVCEDISREDFYFRFNYQRVNYKVPIRDILYFESNRRKVYIVTERGSFELYAKLNDIENSLEKCKMTFLRVHQSFHVSYKHVDEQLYDKVVMSNGKIISISEDRRKVISEQYCSMEDTFYVDE